MTFRRMRRTTRAVVALAGCLAAGLAVAAPTAGAAPATPDPAAADGRGGAVLIVHVDPARSLTSLARGAAVRGLDVRHRFGALHAFSVRVPATDVAGESARLAALPGVTGVERSVERHFAGSAASGDPYFASRQAGYLNAVRAPQSWSAQPPPAQRVKIAVLDSGIDVKHPDLANQVAMTYNAHDGSAVVTDEIGHGTFVAGVAAAESDNGKGVAGASAKVAEVYAVKIADPDGAIELDDEVAGIRWATAQHVDVINLSLGGPDRSRAEAAAIADAQRAGIVVVAAAGNESDSARSYPAAYPGVIAVGATDTAARTRASFSNYGSWVTAAAPGVNIFSTVPGHGSQMWPDSKTYAFGDGTSFSTPLVVGEVALMRARNPHATVAQIRHAVVAAAHGYAHLGLGAGQVDFALGLKHVPPASAPTAAAAAGHSGYVRLTAGSTAPRVAFRIDSDPQLRPVPVSGGVATRWFSTLGLPNGTHRVRAYDCTAYDECGSASASQTFTLDNPAPVLTSPGPGRTITGRVLVTAGSSVGGAVRLLIDGRPQGVLDAAPYAFAVSTSDLRDGPHVLAVQSCSADHERCLGPRSPAVTVTAHGLHPRVTGLTPARVSPNADRVRDTATLRFTLADRETVVVRVVDAGGRTVRSYPLGSLAAGAHTWAWRAQRTRGRRLPDGRYALVLDTARGALRGWVSRAAVVDTARPALARPSGAGARIYPYRDGYRDAFTTRTRLGEAGRLTLTVRSATGRVVRTVRITRPAGPATISWNGRRGSGARVPPGTYRWQLRLTDAAGNTTQSRTYRIVVSGKRLVTVTRFITKRAAETGHAGGTSRCAYARPGESRYAGGVRLVNGCASDGFDLAFADYVFVLPPAVRYGSIAFQVRGASVRRPSELSAAFNRTDGGVEIPRYLKVNRSRASWYTVAAVPGTHHVTRLHRTRISLLLDSFYAGRNDFDAASVRVRARMTILR